MFRESVGWECKRGGMTILQIVPGFPQIRYNQKKRNKCVAQ